MFGFWEVLKEVRQELKSMEVKLRAKTLEEVCVLMRKISSLSFRTGRIWVWHSSLIKTT